MNTIPYHEGAAVLVQDENFKTVRVLCMDKEFYDKYAINCYWLFKIGRAHV